jgi:hypothetical protein
MSDFIDRVFASLPESEWAGEPLNLWGALRPDVEPLSEIGLQGTAPRPPAESSALAPGCTPAEALARWRAARRRNTLERVRRLLAAAD